MNIVSGELALFEGGTLSSGARRAPHVHVHMRDRTMIFGLAFAIDNDSFSLAHVWEHMVMRSRSGEGEELVSLLERENTRRYWYPITTARTVSFEIGSYTAGCYLRSAMALSRAVFKMDISPEAFVSETHASLGRATAEDAMDRGTRSNLFARAARSLLGVRQDHMVEVTLDRLITWHRQFVRPARALWYTYGNFERETAEGYVNSIMDSLYDEPSGNSRPRTIGMG
jgi:hypothetical protein